MAGDPLNGGGFIIVNGMKFDDEGQIRELETPYPGSNLFSLASGGAIYVRDPSGKVDADQLNGGQLTSVGATDWNVILPYLQENQRLFGVCVEDLLKVGGQVASPSSIYRKVEAISLKALAALNA